MHARERVLYLVALLIITAVNIALVSDRLGGSPAHAEAVHQQPQPQPHPQQPAPQDLGPADSLALIDTGDPPQQPSKHLELRNRHGHLSWGQQPYHAAHSVAFVHLGEPISQLLTLGRYDERRQGLRDELQQQAQTYERDLRELYDQLNQMRQDDPAFATTQEQANKLFQEFRRWEHEAQQRTGKLEAELIQQAYEEILVAVEVVADRQNIDVVLRFIPTDEAFEAQNPQQAQFLIRGRSALKYPDYLDITSDVMDELALRQE